MVRLAHHVHSLFSPPLRLRGGWGALGFLLLLPSLVWAGGTVTGQVRFQGVVPRPKTILVTNDESVCGSKKIVETGIGKGASPKDKMVKGALLYIKGTVVGSKALVVPPESLVIDQKGCEFIPRVLLVPVGVPFLVRNSDLTLHNFRTDARENRPLNQAQSKGSSPLSIRFDRPEIIPFGCDVHPWMKGWVVVAPHAYYALSDEKGRYSLADIPAGDYTVGLWHELFGEQQKKLVLREGETVSLDFILESK
ncbi:MAG: carboxypeptidase regulatory-like domain-containing protein [Deltaproteobacteria bacterium]|nr:carboxypeptidase regulatory-like domain-containing protein [Deltaproteobacteria bacterium]